MKLKIRTEVSSGLQKVKDSFTEELFLSLNPPFPPVKLLQFDGCKKGDKVALELNFLLFKQKWVSDITHDEEHPQLWMFVDEGRQLPFFLSYWVHKHIVEIKEGKTYIVDNITFKTGTILTDLLMYPALYLQFLYRKPIYRKTFR